MSMTDPIASMFTQIRNGYAAKKETVEVPFSKLKLEIGKILEKEGFVQSVESKGRRTLKGIEITLKYVDKLPVLSEISRISKPGQRMYSPVAKLHTVKGGRGLIILSTSKGLMTNKEARKLNIGGELIGEVS